MNTARLKLGHPLFREPQFRFRLVVLIAVAALFTLILYPNLMVTKLAYTAGDVAEKDIKAPKDFLVEDKLGIRLGKGAFLALEAEEFSWTGLLWSSVFAFLGGIGSGVVAGGIVPLTEIAFGYTTDITLLELANLDRPILRQPMMEAPGTYHHSVIVGSMAEAAAAEIDANPLLGKVAGYYHDNGIHHHRIEYVEHRTATGGNGKGRPRNGHSDRQPPKASQDLPENDSAGSPNPVRRLKAS
jgi:putative nucleotidyltransferase with HDIG domain